MIFPCRSGTRWMSGSRAVAIFEVARLLEQAGVALLDLSQCITETPGAGFDPMYYEQGWTMYASEAIKKVVKIPVVNSHTLRDPEYCDRVIAEGKTDMVGLSRQLLADPYWPVKAKGGKVKEIRKCISCLTGCWQDSMLAKKHIACAVNPAVGDMRYEHVRMAEKPMRIAIVGGGPAGMEAARLATIRGHSAVIFEKSGELGGAILGCCIAPGKIKMKWYTDWIRYQIEKLKVDVKLRTEPTIEELKKYDVVVNATGASSFIPKIAGLKKGFINPFEEVIACPKTTCEYYPGDRKPKKVGERVVVWGDHFAAADTAAFLASIGKDVTIVTENTTFGSTLEPVHMYVLRKRFNRTDAEALSSKPFKYPVKVITGSTVYAVDGNRVIIADSSFNKDEIKADDIVSCIVKPNIDLYNKLKKAGHKVVNIGDSAGMRNLHYAVKEGANFGLAIDGDQLYNGNAFVDEVSLDVQHQF